MTYLRLTWFFILLAAIAPMNVASADYCHVLPKVTVSLDKVTAADLLSGSEDFDHAKAAGIFICQAPEPGQTRVLKGSFIKSRFAHAGFLNVSVPEKITIIRESSVVQSETIANAVRAKIRALSGGKSDGLEIEFKNGLTDVVVPSGKVKLKVNVGSSNSIRGRVNAKVAIFVNDMKVATKHVDVELRMTVKVWTVKFDTPKGKVLTRDDLVQRCEDLSKLRKSPYQNLSKIVGFRTLRAISGRTVLVEGMLGRAPVVKKGDVVTIIAGSEGLVIKAFGVAGKAGKPGDIISVMNIDSGIKIFARVIDEKSVRAGF